MLCDRCPQLFFVLSGLSANISKAKLYIFDKKNGEQIANCAKVVWTESFKLLGQNFYQDLENLDSNFEKVTN